MAQTILLLPILTPLAGAPLAFLLGGRGARIVSVAVAVAMPLAAARLAFAVAAAGPQSHLVGGWGAPLGIELYADGLSAMMILLTAVVGCATTFFALSYFPPPSSAATEDTESFWALWLFLWAGLSALFLSADAFNLYVTLELVSMAAVAMVALGSAPGAVSAAIRYLLVSVVGSLFYLLGVALLYLSQGTLELAALRMSLADGGASTPALVVMTAGLALKTALFPVHFWLPGAHGSAPTPASALLSALVVKGSFYLLLRLWLPIAPGMAAGADLLGVLGAGAILWGSVLALRQERLKLLVAYSTVAQIGYLFLLFPLAADPGQALAAYQGGVLQALSHGLAKAAMFLAAGAMIHATGQDKIVGLAGIGSHMPISATAFCLAGMTLMGMPPTGGFAAKWLLLNAALGSGQWWWAAIMILGGLLSAGYVLRVASQLFIGSAGVAAIHGSWKMEIAGLVLALMATLLGLASWPLVELASSGWTVMEVVP